MEHWPVSDIDMGLFTQLWNHLSEPWLPSLFWWMITPDLTERTSWTEPWGRAFWENGMTFDVARPQSFWTYLGCSKRHIQHQYPAPSTTNELEVALLEEWDCNAQRTIRSLISNFYKAVQDCYLSKGRQHKVMKFVGSTEVLW